MEGVGSGVAAGVETGVGVAMAVGLLLASPLEFNLTSGDISGVA